MRNISRRKKGTINLTSGLPLSDEEKAYIRAHTADGPARIAHILGRKKGTVKAYIRRKRRTTEEVIELRIPSVVLQEAQEKGISEDQVRFIALRAILQKVKAKG